MKTKANAEFPVQLLGTKIEWDRLGNCVKMIIQKEGVERLVRIRKAISADAKLPMPPIRIVPYGWEGPNNSGVIYAMVKPVVVKGRFQWCVIVPASTLIIINDELLLRRLLCHEFAHCFWWIKRCLEEEKDNKTRIIRKTDKLSNKQILEWQLTKDRQELIDPARWFGEWDIEHFLPEGVVVLDEANMNFIERWVEPGLPVRVPSLRFEANGTMGFPDKIVAHIRKLEAKVEG